jgi:hypothetical protein
MNPIRVALFTILVNMTVRCMEVKKASNVSIHMTQKLTDNLLLFVKF